MRVLSIDLGAPDWRQLTRQPNIRFGTWDTVKRLSVPWVLGALSQLREGFPIDHLADVRFWPELRKGSVPGSRVGWHRDITRQNGLHRLYSFGAGSITEFADTDPLLFEGACVEYGTELHRARPATYTGPRLLLRITQPHDKCAINVVGIPICHHRPDMSIDRLDDL